ncbi:hypothetical protein Tco_1566044 [Tanacetum coccineum]
MVQEDIGISIAKEKEEVHVEDVQMDEDYDIDHSNTEETLQRSLAKDPFLVCMEVNDQENFMQKITLSSIYNDVKKEFKIPHRFSLQRDGIRGPHDSFYVVKWLLKYSKYVLWKPSRDFTRPLGPSSGLKGLLYTLNAIVIPTKILQADAHGVVLG